MIQTTKINQIERKWHLFDATDKVLGRLSTRLVPLLTGKYKPYYVSHLDCGDHVVVVNSEKIRVSGRKESNKEYQHYSGFPGGLKNQKLADLRSKFPTRILEHSVSGMLPDNKLKAEWMGRLHLFVGDKHPYADKFKVKEAADSVKLTNKAKVSVIAKTAKKTGKIKSTKTK